MFASLLSSYRPLPAAPLLAVAPLGAGGGPGRAVGGGAALAGLGISIGLVTSLTISPFGAQRRPVWAVRWRATLALTSSLILSSTTTATSSTSGPSISASEVRNWQLHNKILKCHFISNKPLAFSSSFYLGKRENYHEDEELHFELRN